MKMYLNKILAFMFLMTVGFPTHAQVVEGKYPREFNAESSWIKDGNAEAYIKGWVGYNDSAEIPVDGTGGTVAGVTIATSTTSPLEGKKSFVITKDAANRQGIGFAIPFTIDSAYKNDAQTVSFKFDSTSGTFVAGTDIKIYLYDVTNAKLVNLTSNSLRTDTNGTFAEVFQATGSTSYRLLVHIASTSALAYNFRVDALKSYAGMVMGGIPKNEFVVELDVNGAVLTAGTTWITNCSVTDTSLFTCPLVGFTSKPICLIGAKTSSDPGANQLQATIVDSNTTATQLQFRSQYVGAKTNVPTNVRCTKTGSDYIQNTVSAPNWNFDWTTCPFTVISSLGSQTILCKWKRQGGDATFDITSNFTGTPGGGSLSYVFPVTFDLSKQNTILSNGTTPMGGRSTGYHASGGYNYYPVITDANTILIAYQNSLSAGATAVTNTAPVSIASGTYVNVKFSMPIVGWQETYNAIQLNGSVTTDDSLPFRIEAWQSETTDCISSPCGTMTKTSGISSVTRTGVGNYEVNFSKAFSANPICVASNFRGGSGHICNTSQASISTTKVLVICQISNTGGTATDSRFGVMCIGPR